MFVCGELKVCGERMAVDYFKVLYQHWDGRSEENCKHLNHGSWCHVCGFNQVPPRNMSYAVSHYPTCFINCGLFPMSL